MSESHERGKLSRRPRVGVRGVLFSPMCLSRLVTRPHSSMTLPCLIAFFSKILNLRHLLPSTFGLPVAQTSQSSLVSQQGQLFMQLECAQTSSSFGDIRDFFARCPLERSMRSTSVIFGPTTDRAWCHHTLLHASFASQAAFCGCGFLWRFIAIQVSQKSAVASSTYPLIRARCCCATNGPCWRLESISYSRLLLSILQPGEKDEHSRLTPYTLNLADLHPARLDPDCVQ